MCVCVSGRGGAVYWSLLVCKCVSWRVCAQVCTHSVILVPVLSDAHRERQIHSEKQIVPLWWVWSGLREKRQSENQRRNGERKTDKVPTSVSKSEARCIVYLLFAFCRSSLHQKESFILLPLPLVLICMPFCGTLEMNCSITEYPHNSELNCSLLRKDIALESIYSWEKKAYN